MTVKAMQKIRDENNSTLPAFAWPGGYPVYYLANAFEAERDNAEQLEPVAYDIHWEGEAITCDNCNTEIESAYGPVEGEQ